MFENLKILYLEDEAIVALDTGDHLSSMGFAKVAVVSRLASAERLIAEEEFDLALLDINVDRGQTSLALGEALAKRGTKVVFASGNSGAARQVIDSGSLFLDKPFSLQQLSAMLKEAVDAQT